MSKFRLQEPPSYKYHGLNLPVEGVKAEVLDRIREHTFDPQDILIATYLKSGKFKCYDQFLVLQAHMHLLMRMGHEKD